MQHYPITIHGIFIAPEHRVFGNGSGSDLTGQDIQSLKSANLIQDSGIEGDRFCKPRPDYNGHVTFFSLEVWEKIARELSLSPTADARLTRRNILVSGIDLKALYEQPFEISGIHFTGTVHCAPCLAMNRSLGKGARAAMRSLGGLRAQVNSSGTLELGSSILKTEANFDPQHAATPEPELDLP